MKSSDIILMHDEIIKNTGGDMGVYHISLLELTCSAPFKICNGQELYPTIFDKIARLAIGIAHHKPFQDGNKRTAFEICSQFLKNNGYYISPEILADIINQTSNNNEFNIPQISDAIRENVIFIETGYVKCISSYMEDDMVGYIWTKGQIYPYIKEGNEYNILTNFDDYGKVGDDWLLDLEDFKEYFEICDEYLKDQLLQIDEYDRE